MIFQAIEILLFLYDFFDSLKTLPSPNAIAVSLIVIILPAVCSAGSACNGANACSDRGSLSGIAGDRSDRRSKGGPTGGASNLQYRIVFTKDRTGHVTESISRG